MSKRGAGGSVALLLIVIAASLAAVLGGGGRASAAPDESSSPCNNGKSDNFSLESTIAFTSTRDTTGVPVADDGEIYLMNPDGTNLRRLTDNNVGDGFALLSPDGKRIVFDRLRNHADIVLMTLAR